MPAETQIQVYSESLLTYPRMLYCWYMYGLTEPYVNGQSSQPYCVGFLSSRQLIPCLENERENTHIAVTFGRSIQRSYDTLPFFL